MVVQSIFFPFHTVNCKNSKEKNTHKTGKRNWIVLFSSGILVECLRKAIKKRKEKKKKVITIHVDVETTMYRHEAAATAEKKNKTKQTSK